nr:zinc finger protein 501-like isoform X2 [Misgurnus anguillicaudatus]
MNGSEIVLMMDVMCCKSVGTDLSMLDIDDFMTEISQLKKEVALLETKLRLRGDEGLKREDSELSLTLLCYTESKHTDAQDTTVCDSNQDLQDDESTDQTSTESLDSVCNAGEQQQILQTKLNMCSVKLVEMRRETITEDHHTDGDNHDDDDFFPPGVKSDSSCVGEITSTSKERVTAQTFSCITGRETLSSHGHLEGKHTEQKLFTCSRCEMTFTTVQEQRRHSNVHREKRHCELCSKVYISYSGLKHHMLTHSGERPFHCTECDMRFRSRNVLVTHKRTHTGEKPYKCPHCEMRFTQKPCLKKHVFLHTNERPYQCSECGKTFRDSVCLKTHQKIHYEKQYECSHCDKRFCHKSQLTSHQRVHTGEKPYLCSQCGKSFSCSSSLRDHQRVHTGEKPYQCNVCGKSFTKHYNLSSHRRTHTGERPYKCSLCENTFTQAVLLRIHLRVHTGEKPYVCSICGERFANVGPFKTHQKKHVQSDLNYEKDFVKK